MILKIVNYAIKIFFIILGILLLSGVILPNYPDKFYMRLIGGIFLLWGTYRVITYYFFLKRYRKKEEDNDEE